MRDLLRIAKRKCPQGRSDSAVSIGLLPMGLAPPCRARPRQPRDVVRRGPSSQTFDPEGEGLSAFPASSQKMGMPRRDRPSAANTCQTTVACTLASSGPAAGDSRPRFDQCSGFGLGQYRALRNRAPECPAFAIRETSPDSSSAVPPSGLQIVARQRPLPEPILRGCEARR
jgi:hypothetical protein